MEQKKLPTLFFVYPEDKFSNDIIYLNSENRYIKASETEIQYKKESLSVWEVDLKSLRLLWKNRISIPGFKFKIYIKINDRFQSWRLLELRKKAKAALIRKRLEKIGQRKIEAKRQAPTE